MRKKGIKAVIFDIGGVTIKWDEGIVFRYIARKTGISAKQIGKASDRYMPLFETARMTEKQFWSAVSRKIGYKGHLDGAWLSHYGRYAKKNRLVVDVVRECRQQGYKTAAITNVIRPHYLYNRKTGLYLIFDKVFASCVMKKRKPGLGIYRAAVRQLGVRPDECIFFDDVPRNVAAARRAGIKAYRFTGLKSMKRDMKKNGVLA